MTIKYIAVAALITGAFVVPCTLVGCGSGGGGKGASLATNGRSSRLTIKVKWPVRGRLIPVATASIEIDIKQKPDGTEVKSVTIPQGQTDTTISPLPAADLTLTATALDTNGAAIASGSMDVTTTVNAVKNVPINMDSTVDHLLVTPDGQDVMVGGTLPLHASGVNKDGEMVLLTPSMLSWKSSDDTVAKVDSTAGVVTGVMESTSVVTITAADRESTKRGTATVTVKPVELEISPKDPQLLSLGGDGSPPSVQLTVNQGTPPYAWTVETIQGLSGYCVGVTVDPTTNIMTSGQRHMGTFLVKVEDSKGRKGQTTATVTTTDFLAPTPDKVTITATDCTVTYDTGGLYRISGPIGRHVMTVTNISGKHVSGMPLINFFYCFTGNFSFDVVGGGFEGAHYDSDLDPGQTVTFIIERNP